MPKNITLDDLAAMVAKGFEDMGTRFDRIEDILKNHEFRIKHLENRRD